MKVGLIADVHGNAGALLAVLEAARRRNVERLVCCGDIVGYYYEPDVCLKLLAPWTLDGVRGNHEEMLAKLRAQPDRGHEFRKKYGSGLDVALAALSPSQVDVLCARPPRTSLTIDGKTILVCHGAPWDVDAYVYPDADDTVFDRVADAGTDYVIMGHTHYRLARRVGSTLIINPGSVGQARDRKPGAAWALLDVATGEYEHNTEPYDLAPLIASAQRRDPHLPYLWEVLVRS